MDPTKRNELRAAKADRSENNKDWLPVDLAHALVEDLESGALKANKMLVIYWDDETDDDGILIGQYRAGISRQDELCMAQTHAMKTLNRWFGIGE